MKNYIIACLLMISMLPAVAQDVKKEGSFSNSTIQVGVVVSDLNRAVDFYTNVIGMKKTGMFSVSAEKGKELGLTNGRKVDVTVLKLEDSAQANEWKLMSFGNKAAHPGQKFIHDDTGMQYITIFVTKLQPFIERIQKNNVKILSGTPSILENGNGFILIQDPDGTFIELIGPQ